MKLDMVASYYVMPEQLAQALITASPDEFAAVWLEFSKLAKPHQLDEFAKAMAPDWGGNRKQALRNLCRLVDFHEIKMDRKDPEVPR